MKLITSLFILLASTTVFAALPPRQAPAPGKILAGQGETIGGVAGSGFTLMDLRRTASKNKKLERIVIDVGDRDGALKKGLPGYYHVELKQNPARLVVDFSQMPRSVLDQNHLINRMRGSAIVTQTAMSLDPVDNTLNLTFGLKKNTKVRVLQVAGQKSTSKVVIDLLAQ